MQHLHKRGGGSRKEARAMKQSDLSNMIEQAARDGRCDFTTAPHPETGEIVYTLSFRGVIVGTMRIVTVPELRVEQIPARTDTLQRHRARFQNVANAVVRAMFAHEAV